MSVALLLEMAASGCGDRIALGSRTGGTSFTQLHALAGGAGTVAVRAGARHLVTVAVTGPLLPLALFGAAVAGIPAVPLNYRLPAGQLEDLLATLDSPLVVADDAYLAALQRPGRDVISTAAFLAAAAAAEPMEQADVDDDAATVVLFTSGTTARPKGVVLTHANLLAYVMGTVEFAGAGEEEAALVAVPPYHVAGVGSALSNAYAGRRVVHLPQFDPARWLALAREEAVTSAMVVPTMLAWIVDHLGGAAADLPALASLAYGGARMPRPVLERALAALPHTGFVNAYGLTETSSSVSVLGPDDHRGALASDDDAVRARLGSVGRALPGIELEIRDEAGVAVPPGEVGELFVRGEQVSGAYVGTGSVLDGDGWFATRDRARLDAEGFLFVEGRSDDTIIRGGENIAPAEIEDVLVTHPAVRECAVVGLPDEEWGERLAAAVVLHEGKTAAVEDIRSWLRERVRGSRTPDDVVVVTALPYTPTGKLVRRQLVGELAAARVAHRFGDTGEPGPKLGPRPVLGGGSP